MSSFSGQDCCSDSEFSVAIAVTQDHWLMACGFLARLREFHPNVKLFILTDASSYLVSRQIAEVYAAEAPIIVNNMGFDCLEWGEIVMAKILVFALPTQKPVLFLDIDQILFGPLNLFVSRFIASGFLVAGGADDEPMQSQFRAGSTPPWVDPNDTYVLNTGAFIVRPSISLFESIKSCMPQYIGRVRLPTQGILNGFLHQMKIPFEVYGNEFMIGPFNPKVLECPFSAVLLHLWTPRPPFVVPNPKRVGVDGDLNWHDNVSAFEFDTRQPYPYIRLRNAYMTQIRTFEESYGAHFSNMPRDALHLVHYREFERLHI